MKLDPADCILLISEYSDECQILQAQIEMNGFWGQVVTAVPETVFAKVDQVTFALIICDRPSEHVWGVDLCRRLATHTQAPIVAIELSDAEKLEGVTSVLPYPCAVDMLHQSVVDDLGYNPQGFQMEVLDAETQGPYRDLFERASDVILLMDLETHLIIDMNQQAEALYGYLRNELIGKSLLHLIPREEHPSMLENTRKLRQKSSAIHEIKGRTHICKDGSLIQVSISAGMIEVGGRKMIQDIVRNETHHYRTEQALRVSQAFHQKTIDALTAHIAILDAAGNIISVNQAWKAFAQTNDLTDSNYSVGKNYIDVCDVSARLGSKDATLVAQYIREIVAGVRNKARVEYPCHSRKTKRWFVLHISRFETGESVRVVIAHENITERKLGELSIQNANAQLEKRVKARTKALLDSREELRNLSAYLQNVREEERKSIAREVHDDLGQALTALKMDLYWLTHLAKSEEEKIEKISAMETLIDTTIRTVQRIATELRPGLLDDFGLSAAIEWQAKEFAKRADIVCSLDLEPDTEDLDSDRSTALFRIFQETLTNIYRHAEASQIDCVLKKETDIWVLRVSDNGKGMDLSKLRNRTSFGLMGMQERAEFFGGSVHFSAQPGKGTTMEARIPTLQCGDQR